MCYPALIPLALAAAGAGANAVGQKKVQDQRNDVAKAEAERQTGFENRANAVVDQNLVKQSPAAQNQALAQTTERRTSEMAPLAGGNDALPTSGSAPIEVKSEVARQMADAVRAGRSKLAAQAKLGAFRQNQFDNKLALGEGMRQVGQLQSFSQGSQGVLPYELQAASNAGRGYQTAADLFNLGSQATSLYQQTAGTGGSKATPNKTVGGTTVPYGQEGGYDIDLNGKLVPRRAVSLYPAGR